jgi:hypothetical protein
MGGWNSGRNYRGAGRCESWHRVELAWLRKHDYLPIGARSTLSWHRGGEQTGSVGFHAFDGYAELRYSCNGEDVVQRINYRYPRPISAAGAFGSNVQTATGPVACFMAAAASIAANAGGLPTPVNMRFGGSAPAARPRRSARSLVSRASSTAPTIFQKSRRG